MGFPDGSEVKASASQCGKPGFDPWVGKIPWTRKWQPTPVFLPGGSHGQRSLVGYSPRGRRVRHDWANSLHFTFKIIRLYLQNFRGREMRLGRWSTVGCKNQLHFLTLTKKQKQLLTFNLSFLSYKEYWAIPAEGWTRSVTVCYDWNDFP